MLRTKLHRPPLTREHVNRNHLIDLLDQNLYKPLTLVSAGAGYGKSTLISSWLERSNLHYAWVSLSEEEDDLRSFLAIIFASVRKTFPEALDTVSDLLEAPALSPMSILLENLGNDLDEIEKEFVLVLDDYHIIHNEEIHELISRLLHFPPQLMHLVIVTRHDPFLDLSSLRAYSRINEIRGGELSFQETEIVDLFDKLFSTPINTDLAKELLKRTEGWITGIRLASLMVRPGENVNDTFNNIPSNIPNTVNFLIKEVLSKQAEPLQSCIIQLAVLDRFCEELVDDLIYYQDFEGDISGKEAIQKLVAANLFTIPLDHAGKWFRYHHLFRDLLKAQLSEVRSSEEIAALHLRASAWFEKHNYLEEAVRYALRANDTDEAVAIISKYRYELINTEQLHRLERLLNLLPEGEIEKSPALLTAKSWYMDFLGMIPEMLEYKAKATAILEDLSDDSQDLNAIRGELVALNSVFYIVSGSWKELIESSSQALELLPRSAKRTVSHAVGNSVVGLQMLYGVESGTEKSKELLIQYPHPSDLDRTRTQLWHSLVFAMMGDTGELKNAAYELMNLGEKLHLAESLVYGRYFLSHAHYMSCEDDLAEPLLEKAVNASYAIRIHYVIQCAYMLASIYIDRGEREKANSMMEQVVRKTVEVGSESATAIVKAMLTELALKEGDLEKAMLLMEERDYNAIMPPIWFVYVPQLNSIKLKLAMDTGEDISEAQDLLREIEGPIRETNKKSLLIDILILQALVCKAQDRETEARLKITEALNISQKGNSIRSYVDFGLELKDLLTSMLNSSEAREHIKKIVQAVDAREKIRTQKEDSISSEVVSQSGEKPPSISLSVRELEVLKLVALGMRNKEVAEQLFIQIDTVKKHMKSIFEKLNASNRLEAVKLAGEHGLFAIA